MNVRNSVILIVSILVSIHVFGQTEQTKFGIKGGVNLATDGGDIGYQVGGFTAFNFTEKLSLRPEILFSLQHMDYDIQNDNEGAGGPYTGSIKEYFISLPLLLKYKLIDNFEIAAGPQFGYILDQDIKNNSDSFTLRSDDWDKFEFAVASEVGYVISEEYRVGLRYIYGINKRYDINTSLLQLSLEYKF